ncbi:MAG TPA: tetratricopeptide repeat protein [Candidatus Acidoferrales bacterium]|nr:tetratricopeptide repeat protein [Candidatus Acidoferrales bacterium]
MAFNKTKHVESAQKSLNQGKIAQAIAEYQQVLRHEPRDQVTLMTVGDLYVRLGETFQALEYFERLAQVYLSEGFLTKAIAIYKKIAKLAPEESKPLERLAELYVQQGVMSEARPLYLQLAETHLQANRHQQALALLQKLLEVEPDNLRVQTRLAELYHTIGQHKEAAAAFLGGAQRLLSNGDHTGALRLAERALKVVPSHIAARAFRARALVAAGNHAEAVTLLESLPDLDSDPEASALLVEQYLKVGQAGPATTLAQKVFERDPKSYSLAFQVAASLMELGDLDRGLPLLGQVREPMIAAGDHDRLAQALAGAAQRAAGNLEPLEWLVDLCGRTNDSFRLPDALAQLAEAAAAAGQLKQAKQAYERLLDRSPEDEDTRQRLNQVLARMGLEPLEEVAGARAVSADKVTPKPSVEVRPMPAAPPPTLDEETHRYVVQALTDVDLFSSYGLTQKAMELLETVLRRAPRHSAALEKLLDLYLGAGDERRTAELAAQLEQIHLERGDTANAERFSELRHRFQRAAGLAAEELVAATEAAPPADLVIPAVDAEPMPLDESQTPAEVAAGEVIIHEVDLSAEWAMLAHQVEESARATPTASAQAPGGSDLRAAESAVEYEFELEPADKDSPPGPSQKELAAQPTPSAMSSEEFLTDLAKQFSEIVPSPRVPEARVAKGSTPAKASPPAAIAPPASAHPPVPSAAPEDADPLREIFDQFRTELGEMGEEEDLETHYNLGIAYREMGLLEEAIGELQKVATANSKGRAFRYAMQCCTLLGLAFMEKGQPAIAVVWYERALQTPGLDQESILALRYDLGVAQEMAGDKDAALKSFSQVYAMNIDYRDIGERIASLQKRR